MNKNVNEMMLRIMQRDWEQRHAPDNMQRTAEAQRTYRQWHGALNLNTATAVQGLYR